MLAMMTETDMEMCCTIRYHSNTGLIDTGPVAEDAADFAPVMYRDELPMGNKGLL